MRKLTNVAIAVKDIQEGIDHYCKVFGVQHMGPIGQPSPYGFRNAWLGDGEKAFIELLESVEPDSIVDRFIKRRGEGIYMVSFDVDNLTEAVRYVRANGGRVTGLPEGEDPKPDTKFVWVHPSTTKGAFIEMHPPGTVGQ